MYDGQNQAKREAESNVVQLEEEVKELKTQLNSIPEVSFKDLPLYVNNNYIPINTSKDDEELIDMKTANKIRRMIEMTKVGWIIEQEKLGTQDDSQLVRLP